MRDRLRVGIAGFGVVGEKRYAVCRDHPELHVVAVCDRKFTQPTALAGGLAAFTTPAELLQAELDVLLVCLPNDVAPDTTIAGLEAGLHVFCEKPPGRTVEDVVRVQQVERESKGQKLQYGFNHRYHESVQLAKRTIEDGSLGRLINARGVYGKSAFIPWPRPQAGDPYELDSQYWRTSHQVAGGGILLDQGIHMVDLMHLFVAEPFEEVHAFVDNGYWGHDVEDNAYAIMRSRSGVVAMLHSSATLWRHRFSLDLSLTEGSLQLSGILSGTKSYGEERLTMMHREDEAHGLPTEYITTFVKDESWAREIDEFVRCILEDKPVTCGRSEDARSSMETVHRIYQADPSWAGSRPGIGARSG